MTVSYTKEVATCQGFSCFLKLLLRWRGSIYKLVWRDLVVFLFIYFTININYRFAFSDASKETFEKIAKLCRGHSSSIPLSFVLGFYVSIVMKRWWDQYIFIPRPDPVALIVSAAINGQDDRGRVIRRTIMRYVCLSGTMLFTNISPRVKKRFPNLDHLVKSGLLEESEANIIQGLDEKFPTQPKYWLPLVWAASIITRARKEGRIMDDCAVKTMLDEINIFRSKCARLINYDQISIPLVYTQVVTLAVYSYFIIALIGDQITPTQEYHMDTYFPIFTLLQFFFFMGWLKVAESLINPFGDDDDDFEINWMVDRNLSVSYLIVDEMHYEHPELMKDHYWTEVVPEHLPYSELYHPTHESHPATSTMDITAKQHYETGSNFHLFPNKNYYGSQVSVASTINSFMRNNSFTNSMRRMWHRHPSQSDPEEEPQEFGQLKQAVRDKIIEQIIEEVDEQMTVMSKKRESAKPSIFDVFGMKDQEPDSPDAFSLLEEHEDHHVNEDDITEKPPDEKKEEHTN